MTVPNKAIEILDDLLYGYILLPGVRDEEGRDLLMFPVPDKGVPASYEELETVSNYLIHIPRQSVLNNGIVALVDATDNDWQRIEDIVILIQQLQAKNPGMIVMIRVIAKPNYKTRTKDKIRDMSQKSGIEVLVHTSEELGQVLPARSIIDVFGGKVEYDNNTWVRFRLNVEPFLSDCQSMGRRLEDIVRPLTDVESIITDHNYDVQMVANKYKEIEAETMKNLHMEQLLSEGKQLIERYQDVAKDFPDMQDTLQNISNALSHLKNLQSKIENLASMGQSKAENLATYLRFKKQCDELLSEMRTQHKQVEDMTEQGLYDVNSVETRQLQLNKLRIQAENIHLKVKRCTNEGKSLPNTNKGQTQRDNKQLQTAWDKLNALHAQKKDAYALMLSFHQLVEECMSWFFSGIQRFTSQPVVQCNTLEGICDLEQELDRHLSRCPIQGYTSLEDYGTKIGSRAAISRIKMIKTKFTAFQEIVKERQEYLKRQKMLLLQRKRNNVTLGISERATMTGLHTRDNRYSADSHTTKSTQFERMDVFGYSRNSSIQTSLTCICSNDRIKHLSLRISSIEKKLNLPDRAVPLSSKPDIRDQLGLILKRICIIENYLKRLRFSSVYDSFYNHPEKYSSKNSSEILSDLQNDSFSFGDSGFNSRPPTEQTLSNRPDTYSPKMTSPPFTPSTTILSPTFTPTTILSPTFTPTNTARSSGTDTARSSAVVSPKSAGYTDELSNMTPFSLFNISDEIISGQSNLPDTTTISGHSGQSTPSSSVRRYSRNKVLSPSFNVTASTPVKPEGQDLINEKLVEIEKLLVDIEYEVQHDLKVDGETQTTEYRGATPGSEHTESSSQTETDSDTESESIGVQHSVNTSISSTQHEIETAAQSVQCAPLNRAVSTDTGITQMTSASQHDAISYRTTQSQTPAKHLKHTSSQYLPGNASKGVQHYNIGSEVGVQHCPVHSHIGVQQTPLSSQTGSQTTTPEYTSSESQVSSEDSDCATQTDMIGLFPASVQTDMQHFAAKHSQTEVKSEEKGTHVVPSNADKAETADIKPVNHKESSADIKSQNHQECTADIKSSNHVGIAAVVEVTTRGTAAKFIKMFSKSVETTPKPTKQSEVQTRIEQTHRAQDTSDISTVENKTTTTENLVFYDTDSTQTSLFEPVLINTPAQTDLETTLIRSDITTPTATNATQTSDLDIETDAGDDSAKTQRIDIDAGKVRKVKSYPLQSRSDPHMSFKDVSYNKNKTHELRVARIKKSQEEQEQRAKERAKAKKIPKKRAPKKKGAGELKCTCDEVHETCDSPVISAPLPPPDPVSPDTMSPDLMSSDVMPPGPLSPDPMSPSASTSQIYMPPPPEILITDDTLDPMDINMEIPPIEEEQSEAESESDEEEDWSTASIVFPVEECPSPITQRSEPRFTLVDNTLPKKLQYVLQEMLETEESYVRDLTHVVEQYIEPMEQHPDKQVNHLADQIFVFFRQICSFHSNTFCASLIAAATTTTPLKEVANTFIRHEQDLALYLSFMVQERKSHTIVEQNHEGVIAELETKVGDMLGLSSYLIKPTQRMVKYKQFLDIMLAGSENKEFEIVEEIATAQTLIANILGTTNDLCHLQALELPERLTADVTGELIKQEEFKVSTNGGAKSHRRVFLFESMIVLAKVDVTDKTEQKYRTKDTVGMDEIGLTPYLPDEPLKCHLWTSQSTFTMFANTETIAKTWSECISNILWGQLKQIKRDRDMSRIRKTRGRGTSRGRGGLLRLRRDQ